MVGFNGAGKSTIVKLLLHMYDPVSGEILWNENGLEQYSTEEYRKHIGNVFQDFNYYAMTIAENILLREPLKEDRERIMKALDKVGLLEKVKALPKGMDTPLTKEFSEEGTMFSGGELQAMMLARLFVFSYDLIVLDEPTSALDPYAEYKIYDNLLHDKMQETMIIISHRLLTTKNVDCIYFIENGQIVESGSHDELMNRNKKYAQLYNIQKKYYQAEETLHEIEG